MPYLTRYTESGSVPSEPDQLAYHRPKDSQRAGRASSLRDLLSYTGPPFLLTLSSQLWYRQHRPHRQRAAGRLQQTPLHLLQSLPQGICTTCRAQTTASADLPVAKGTLTTRGATAGESTHWHQQSEKHHIGDVSEFQKILGGSAVTTHFGSQCRYALQSLECRK